MHTSEAASGGEPRKYSDLPEHLKSVVDKIKVDPQNHLNADQLAVDRMDRANTRAICMFIYRNYVTTQSCCFSIKLRIVIY